MKYRECRNREVYLISCNTGNAEIGGVYVISSNTVNAGTGKCILYRVIHGIQKQGSVSYIVQYRKCRNRGVYLISCNTVNAGTGKSILYRVI